MNRTEENQRALRRAGFGNSLVEDVGDLGESLGLGEKMPSSEVAEITPDSERHFFQRYVLDPLRKLYESYRDR